MKMARTNKIILLTVALVLCLVASVLMLGVRPASAAVSGSNIFTYVNGTHKDSEIVLENGDANIPMSTYNTVKLKNKVVVNDFAISVKLPQEFTKLTLTLTSDTYDVNGVKVGTEYKKTVDNSFVLTNASGALSATYNGGAEVALGTLDVNELYSLSFKKNGNLIDCEAGNSLGSLAIASGVNNKVESTDKIIAEVSITVECSADCTLKINSIDQKASDVSGAFKQTFVTENDVIKTRAFPRAELSKGIVHFNGDKVVMAQGAEIPLSVTAYSIVDTFDATTMALVVNSGSVKQNEKTISFNQMGTAQFSFVDGTDNAKVYEIYDVDVVDFKQETGETPKYVGDADAINSFTETFTEKLWKNKEKGEYVAIGSGQYLELPSLQSLVADDWTNYENMSYTVYYKTPTTSSTTTSNKIPLESAGDYLFYVLFKDKNGNEMKTEDFIKTDADDADKVEINNDAGKYGKYVFTFSILDNSPFQIKSVTQAKGYIGVSYSAADFSITATSYTSQYKLYYSETDTETSVWKEIPKASSVKEGDTIDGFTYDEVQKIAYNGTLNFTPQKAGYYKLECVITSRNSEKTETAQSTVTVTEKPTVVKPDSNWLQNNVWSVVFLSVGTVCLIAIIVLLCIKPKDKVDD